MGSIPIISTRASSLPAGRQGFSPSPLIINAKTIRRTYRRRPFIRKRELKTKINEFIRAYEVRVVDEEKGQLGVMSVPEALELAREKGLDLVEISPKAVPPVVKIMDFGKYQYQKSKEDRQNKSKQKKSDIKGIRISVRANEHDLNFKKNQAEKFLGKGQKVKIEIILKGREKAHRDLGKENLLKFIDRISVPTKIEQEIKIFPGGFNTVIAPN